MEAEQRVIDELVGLETLRLQMREFLKKHGLATALCDDDAWWHEFLRHYGGVVEDCSLSCRSDPKGELRFVRKVTFSKGTEPPAGAHVPFRMTWDIELIDGGHVMMQGNQVATDGVPPFRTFRVGFRR